jgi:acyl-CoA reductase-like NAD-dependent aldehyde dehydrogenase
MNKFADLLEKHTDEMAILESLDNGKPFAVAKAADVPLSVDNLRYAVARTCLVVCLFGFGFGFRLLCLFL